MTTRPGKVVAVTGASGYIGSKLLQHLEAEPGLRKLVAFDTRPLTAPIHNIAVYRKDVSSSIGDDLNNQNVNTLVHLAFNNDPASNRREAATIVEENVDTLRSVLESCLRSQVEHLVYLSTHTVYGAHQDNPVPITETTPLRPPTDLLYTYSKYRCEMVLQEFPQVQTNLKITVLRPCGVVGPKHNDRATDVFFRPWLLGVGDNNPPLQFIYEDELARVMTLLIMNGVPGVFNIAGSGVVYYRELARAIERRLVNLPSFMAYPAARWAWDLGLPPTAAAAGLDMIRWPILLSTAKLHQSTGYQFWHTSMEALSAFANSQSLPGDEDQL